jgi:hypothetical protein
MTTKIVISLVCGVLAAAHLLWPGIKPDATTLVLLVLGLMPWLTSVIKSIELPGGFKIDLQEVKAATEKVAGVGAPTPRTLAAATDQDSSLRLLNAVASSNPSLALVGLRIEIEKRLVAIAERSDLAIQQRPGGSVLRALTQKEILKGDVAAGLSELIALGNRAAHGASVEPSAAEWALSAAPAVLAVLDKTLLSGDRNAPVG